MVSKEEIKKIKRKIAFSKGKICRRIGKHFQISNGMCFHKFKISIFYLILIIIFK